MRFSLLAGAAIVALTCPLVPAAERMMIAPEDRPQTWFHLIGGNVSKEGLTADLEAIKAAGIGGIQFFHGQMGRAYPWPRTKGQIPCLSAKWDEVVAHAADECARLGLKFEMQNCPGWSMSGGPWITPDKAMRKLVCFRPGEKPAFDADDDYCEIGAVSFPAPAGWNAPDPVPASVVTNGNARTFVFARPVTVRSLELPAPNEINNEWCYEKGLSLRISASDGRGGWKTVLSSDYPRGCWQDGTPVTFAFPAVTSGCWQVAFSSQHPVKCLGDVRFHVSSRLNGWESLGGWAFRDLPARGTATAGYESSGAAATLVFGHVNMKVRNGPAPEEARGWECDKLDAKGFAENFDGYLGRLMKGVLAGGKLKGMVVDSWECERQSWTGRMEEYFEGLNGYALRPLLPALFGYVVGDAEKTERFLLDWRRTVSHLVEENYYRIFAELGRKNGLTVQFETAFQDVIPGDPLRYWKHADIPMCEFWQPFDNAKGYVGSDNFKPVRPCVSAAHVYGKRRVQAEALTSMFLDWDEDFNRFKRVVDHHFARGVTHLVFHTYTHNPQTGKDFLPPGTSFAWCIGSPFLRGQTWWKYMPLFSDYVARCGHELERGHPVVDVLWYLGDDNPYRPDENAPFPKGYKYDYITQDALIERLSVKDGRFVLPDGMSYRLLWIPEGTFLLPESEAKIAALEKTGGRVCRGAFKIDSPSPLAKIGRDPEGGIEWCQRRDGDEDIFFIVEKNGASQFLYVDGKTGEVRIGDPMTGEVKPLVPDRRSDSAELMKPVPCAEYPAWATEREYVMKFNAGAGVAGSAVLDLGSVRSWAEVYVNGAFVRTLWAEPYACEIGPFAEPGENEVRVKVTSTWFNRLVHEAALPESERTTWTIRGPAADEPMRPAGLAGPVRLMFSRAVSNCVPNASFEAGMPPHGVIVSGLFRDESNRPSVSLDDTTAAHGRMSLKIDATRGGSYEFLTPDVELPTNGCRVTVSAFAKADRSAEFRLGTFGFDRDPVTGKELYTCPGKIVKIGTDWTRVVLENVWVDGRCRRLCVKIMGDGPAVLWLDGIQFEIGGGNGRSFRPQAEVEAVWTTADPVFVRDGTNVFGTAELTVVDHGSGTVERRTERFPLERNGLFAFDRAVEFGGRTIRPFPFDYAVVPSMPPYSGKGFALGGNGLTGVSVNRKTGEQVFTAPAGYSLSDYYRDIRRYGLRFVRFHDGNLQWREMASARGVYDWRVTDRVVKGCRAAGLEPMFLFASHGIFVNSPWDDSRFADWFVRKDAAPAGKGPFGHRRYFLPRMDDWTNFVAAAVGRYGDDIRYWEIVNEPNILMASASVYADYARSAYRTVKGLRPDASVVGLCVTGDFGANPGSFLAKAEKTDAFASMDVASVHPYDSPLDYGKRDAETALSEIRATIDRHRPGLPLMQNELYYLYVEKPTFGRWPVRNLVRRYAIDMGCGLSVSAPLAFDSHLGVDAGHRKSLLPSRVGIRFMPNERYVATAAFAHFLEGGRSEGRLPGTPKGVNGYLFRDRAEREVAVVWAREEKDEGTSCRLPDEAMAYDLFGNPLSGRELRLSRDPVYVVGRGLRVGMSYRGGRQ